ncbi:zinc-finger-containing protein [Aeromonas caviae]|uniref:zinc-finger-containing protein n=1 Tax=Aeromonas caviae TaxID=648 RepID=UPI0029D8F158|nr:zinc-finger-containing protein [Aeromonas caviae]MDX7766138.1 zinc-finger-containing protein [Aeromonas caviae]
MARNTAYSHFHPKDCRFCGSPLELVSKQVVYPAAPAKTMIYRCNRDACDSYISCREGTDIAIGSVANRDTRLARREAHASINTLIDSGRMNKHEAYAWMQHLLSLPYTRRGIGWLDEHECKVVVREVREILRRSRYEASQRGIASLRALFDKNDIELDDSSRSQDSKAQRLLGRLQLLNRFSA